MDEALRKDVERQIAAARALVRAADEFWPEHPEAIDEPLGALQDAVLAPLPGETPCVSST